MCLCSFGGRGLCLPHCFPLTWSCVSYCKSFPNESLTTITCTCKSNQALHALLHVMYDVQTLRCVLLCNDIQYVYVDDTKVY